jgi:hypothetical protein
MEPFLPLLIGAIVLTATAVAGVKRRRARVKAWREAAAAAGLADVRVIDDLFEKSLEGREGDLRVRLESYRHGKYESGTRLTIRGFAELSIRREGLGTAVGKRLMGETEVEIGAPAFDDVCFVKGPAPLALAVLDTESRRRVTSYFRAASTSRAGTRSRCELPCSMACCGSTSRTPYCS